MAANITNPNHPHNARAKKTVVQHDQDLSQRIRAQLVCLELFGDNV